MIDLDTAYGIFYLTGSIDWDMIRTVLRFHCVMIFFWNIVKDFAHPIPKFMTVIWCDSMKQSDRDRSVSLVSREMFLAGLFIS